MPEKAIADSSFLVGWFDAADVFHRRARKLSKSLKAEIVFFDCVLNEVYSVLGKRAEDKKRQEDFSRVAGFIQKQVPEEKMIWTYKSVPELYPEIISMMKKHNGALNFHDCLIALSAREHGLDRIVSFDSDFDKIGWLERLC